MAGRELPLVFRRVGPVPLPPYSELQVSFPGAERTVAGSLLLPAGEGPHPALAFFHATSSARRDELRFYADLAARAGFAALIYDRRPVPIDLARLSRADFLAVVADAEAAVRFLRARRGIDAERVGVGGPSHGAWISAIVAARVPEVGFVIALSPPGVALHEIDLHQSNHRLAQAGVRGAELAEANARASRAAARLHTIRRHHRRSGRTIGSATPGLRSPRHQGAREACDRERAARAVASHRLTRALYEQQLGRRLRRYPSRLWAGRIGPPNHDREVTMKDAWTRRECLRIGVTAGLGSAFLPTMSSLSGADATATEEEKGIPVLYLEAGLAALANTWRGGWANGHYGAAMIAAYFFAREVELDERTRAAIQIEVDAFRNEGRQFFEFETPKEEATPDRVPEIAQSLEEGIDQLRGAGHNVIFAALALKAFRHAPALAKPHWIDGILELDQHLREHFKPAADTDFNRAHPIPEWHTPQEMLESALACFVRASGNDAVGLIHGVTHADAVAELWELGYESLAVRGSEALKIHINLDPTPPQPGDALAEPLPDSPLSHRFWENPAVRRETWGFRGHNFKFPYSYYRRRGAIRDADLRKKCDDRALSVIATVID